MQKVHHCHQLVQLVKAQLEWTPAAIFPGKGGRQPMLLCQYQLEQRPRCVLREFTVKERDKL
jgi:hypothetical protein